MKDQLEKRELVGIKRLLQKHLLKAVGFVEHIHNTFGDGGGVICEHLTDTALDDYEEESFLKYENVPKQTVFDLIKVGGPGGIWDKMPVQMQTKIVEWSAKEKVFDPMSTSLKKNCGTFDCKTFTEKTIRGLFDKSPNNQTLLVAGKTQSGKSAFKAVVQSICFELGDPLIIITKGVSESLGLHNKLKDFVVGSRAANFIVSASSAKKGVRVSSKAKKADIKAALNDGGTLVVADTQAQISMAFDAIESYREKDEHRRFVVIVGTCVQTIRSG
jgi:hypothetical protein